jgi:hypothetical protein
MNSRGSPPVKEATRLAGRDAKNKKITKETLADSSAAVNADRGHELVERQGEVFIFRSLNGRTYQVVCGDRRWSYRLEYMARCKAERVLRHGGAQP